MEVINKIIEIFKPIKVVKRVMSIKHATYIINKFLKQWIYKRRVKKSWMCQIFLKNCLLYPLHTLIPDTGIRSYFSAQEKKDDFITRHGRWFTLLYFSDTITIFDIDYSDRMIYFSKDQLNNGDFVYTGRQPTCRYVGQDYCKLFGLGHRGHANYGCIGWCGSIRPNICRSVLERESITLIVRILKRWIKIKANNKKYHHISS